MAGLSNDSGDSEVVFGFRPWVRRAGISIVAVAFGVTAVMLGAGAIWPALRFGWVREPFAWVYVGALWAGGLKILAGTFRPVAELGPESVVVRPLHQLRGRRIGFGDLLGSEQMIGGDRLILYHATRRGMRFVALNLNLVKGRRDFVAMLEGRMRGLGFEEKVVDRSRYLSRPGQGLR
jgi:hypothetical protein